MSGRGFTEGCD